MLKGGREMGDEAKEARLLAVFNDLPDNEKEAVLAMVEKIGQKKAELTYDTSVIVTMPLREVTKNGSIDNLTRMG
jgi:hypothetical protein